MSLQGVHPVRQDLSVAGKRAGLKHSAMGDEETTRSGLFMDQVRIVKEMREHDRSSGKPEEYIRPRYMVWENVCFAEDTLVTCETGYKKISEVSIGEKVKTLSGRYMPVVKTYKHKNKDVVRVSYMGGEDLIVTPNHPIWAREKFYSKNTRCFGEPKWIPAGELTKNHLVAYVLDIPTLPENFISKEEAWAIGRWIADGSVDTKKSNPRIFISCGLKKAAETKEMLERLPYEIYENHPHETAINFTFTSREFYSLIKECGVGAGNKKIPQYVFELPVALQEEVLKGYASGDGYIRNRNGSEEFNSSSASRKLSYGIARLIRNVMHTGASVNVQKAKDGVINGRIIKANYDSYSVDACFNTKVSTWMYEDGIVWQPVRSVVPEGKTTVFNLSVLEDNTYAANDIMGHNCGALSSPGKRNGEDHRGEDFQAVLTEIVRIVQPNAPDVPLPEDRKWSKSGWFYGVGESGLPFSVAYRLHDAQFWGVPQRRKRLALVADFNGMSAPKILFDSEYRRDADGADADPLITDSGNGGSGQEVLPFSQGLCRNSESGCEAWEGTAGDSEECFGESDEDDE